MPSPKPTYALVFLKKDGKQYIANDWHPESEIRQKMIVAAESGLRVVGFVKKRAFVYKDLGIALQALDFFVEPVHESTPAN